MTTKPDKSDKSDKYCRCLLFSANALSRVITSMAEDVFAETGVSPSHAFLLMTVNDSPGIQPGEISSIMLLSPSTVTRLVEKMEQRGFLERQVEGKFTKVFPTAKSLELQPRLRECWHKLFVVYSQKLGMEEGKKLTSDVYTAMQKLA